MKTLKAIGYIIVGIFTVITWILVFVFGIFGYIGQKTCKKK